MTSETLCPVCGQDNGPETGGCDCYGIPEPLPPYYPPTAVLRAFRYAIAYTPGNIMRTSTPVRAYTHPKDGGAWPDERAHGIGRADGRGLLPAGEWHAIARREASALRSRAYRRAFGRIATDAADWRGSIATAEDIAAHQTYEPR